MTSRWYTPVTGSRNCELSPEFKKEFNIGERASENSCPGVIYIIWVSYSPPSSHAITFHDSAAAFWRQTIFHNSYKETDRIYTNFVNSNKMFVNRFLIFFVFLLFSLCSHWIKEKLKGGLLMTASLQFSHASLNAMADHTKLGQIKL